MLQPAYVRSDVPNGCSGEWTVSKFQIPLAQAIGPQQDSRPAWARSQPGIYTQLAHGETVMMTDTHDEWATQLSAINQACSRGGAILISGLGLGVVVHSMFCTPGSRVQHITVLEPSGDVITLVAPHLQRKFGSRLQVVETSAFDWTPPSASRFTVAWHDIWPNPRDASRWPEMEQLEQRFAPYCDWQGCWTRDFLAAEASTADG